MLARKGIFSNWIWLPDTQFLTLRGSLNHNRNRGKVNIIMKITDTLDEIRREIKTVARSNQNISESLRKINLLLETLPQDESLRKNTTNRSPQRKKIVFENGKVNKVQKVPSTRIVKDIIWKSSQGIDTKTLMDKTGYDQRKIYNIIFYLKNRGKIKRVRRGVYGRV
jgi:hypothetical protein